MILNLNIMKKIIGILGVSAIAMALFFSTNSVNANNTVEMGLGSLITINQADAECPPPVFGC